MVSRENRLAFRGTLVVAVIVGCWIAEVGSSPGRDIFVNNEAGDDAFFGRVATPGSTVDGPVRSITRAIELAQPGDRIVLAPTKTPYRESITLAGQRLSRGILQDLILDGNGAVLDGSAPVPVDAWELDRQAWQRWGRAVYRFTPEQRSHQQLFLGDRPAKRVFVTNSSEAPPKLEPLEWCLFEGKIYFCVEPDHRPEDYPLRYAKLTVGITLHHVHGVTIRDLTIQGYQLDGISLANTAREIRLQRVVLRGNGRAGLSIGGACRADLLDSLLGDNGAAQIITFPYSELHVFNSQVLGNTAPAWVDKGGRLFVDGQEKQGGLDAIEPPSPANSSNP
ncbi:hypothetical protein THTE_0577 [Thermogutta terrifontis]|uniref:Right handed beta helix domain-containing protein n=1 Tax=Thermogutta terrifontis TaxID=1331910 RepID=A0A286RB68_9BACT|nr:right-handed parallel beta-helix repeat-containing protein [Thermogutta terrifontis]ASV73179.1 hypothetical protein THTE_0577 [Thermogutta terrifontis]